MLKTAKNVLLWFLPVIFLGIFYFYPLGRILILSYTRDDSGLMGSLINAFRSSTIRGIIGFTIWQAILSTLLTLLLGLPGAYLLARYEFPGKSILRAITGVPFVMPTLVVAAGFNALLGPRGWINSGLMSIFNLTTPPIQFVNSFLSILVAHVFYNTTIVLRMVGDFWSHLNPKIGQAAEVLGANRRKVFTDITIPLLLPVIAAAALLVFLFDFTSFGVVLILGGPQYATIEVEIYYQTISLFNLPLAATLSIIQLGFTLLITFVYTRLSNRISRPISQQKTETNQRKLRSWKNRIFAILVIGTLLLILTSPLLALGTQSVYSLGTKRAGRVDNPTGLTLAFYRALTQNPQESLFYASPTTAIGISLTYAALTVVVSLLVGTPAAWALSKETGSWFSRILDPVIMLPLGTSAVTLGLGFIIALARPPLNIRASPVLIPIAHSLVAFPFVVRSLTPALRSIQPELRQAAALLGASPRQVLRFIDVPLVGRALLVAATFAFTISIGEFGATSLISRPEYPTVPMVIFRLLSRPGGLNYGQALALSTILMGVSITGMLAIEHFRIAEVGEF